MDSRHDHEQVNRTPRPAGGEPGTLFQELAVLEVYSGLRLLDMSHDDAVFLSRAISIPHAPKDRSKLA